MKKIDDVGMWKRHPRLNRIWQRYTLWSLCFDGKMTWFCSDDVSERNRKIDWEIQAPRWVCRPYCWIYGHSPFGDYRTEYCVYCEKILPRGLHK